MSDLIRNPYFATEEVKTYTEGEGQLPVENAPSIEPVKGFTSIIIPAYLNSYPIFHKTGDCIGAIREHTDREKTPYEIILVLNGTKDTIKFDHLETTHAEKVIENEENLGFSKAVNKGIRVAKGEYIAVVNNDVLVFNHWLEDLQEALNWGKDLIMATPMYGMPYARAIEAEKLRNETLNKAPRVEDNFSDFRDFSCILTRKKLFDEIGLFNEEFFCYGEDLDLLRRMDKAGKTYASTKRVNTSHIIGLTSSSMPETPKIMNESKETLKKIWGE
jgi:O-antigen biosynthesis protein